MTNSATKCVTFCSFHYESHRNLRSQVLWPSLHYIIPDAPRTKATYESSSFVQYKAVNEAFAEKIISIWKEGDVSECTSSHKVEFRSPIYMAFTPVWVNDYHLLLLPQLLRARLPKAAIGFFLHVAFPSSEIFRCLAGENFSS
jgi:trehalose 6-phosphate synthase complex regulatory subunit